jgi:hypothetical protein
MPRALNFIKYNKVFRLKKDVETRQVGGTCYRYVVDKISVQTV